MLNRNSDQVFVGHTTQHSGLIRSDRILDDGVAFQ